MSRVGRKGENVTAHTFSLVLDLGSYTELHRLARASHTGPPDRERTEDSIPVDLGEREHAHAHAGGHQTSMAWKA